MFEALAKGTAKCTPNERRLFNRVADCMMAVLDEVDKYVVTFYNNDLIKENMFDENGLLIGAWQVFHGMTQEEYREYARGDHA